MKSLPRRQKSQKGFTLVELLIVIGILGILAVGAIVALNPRARISQAQDNTTKQQVTQVSSALTSYYATNGAYPTTAQTTSVLTSGTNPVLSVWPSSLTYVGNASGTNGAVYFTLSQSDTTSTGCTSSACTVWCYQTSTGQAGPKTNAAACTAP